MQQQNSMDSYLNGGTSSLMFPEVSPVQPWTLPQAHNFQTFPSSYPVRDHHHHDPYLLPSTIPYGGLFNRRMPYHHDEGGSLSDGHHLSLLTETCFGGGQHHNHHYHGGVHQSSSSTPTAFGFQAGDLQKMTAQEIMDAKALAASKSHSEAERRRRERINNHLSKLRSLLPNTTKTDKASLLAEVIQHVKELKRQTSLIVETSPIPTEMDELIVDNSSVDEDGNSIIKASLCCEDRSDLLTDLIKTLKAMRLRTLKAEIATMGGRVKNVLFITGDRHETDIGDDQQQQQCTISSIKEALKAVMEKASVDESGSGNGNVKRQRTNIINTL